MEEKPKNVQQKTNGGKPRTFPGLEIEDHMGSDPKDCVVSNCPGPTDEVFSSESQEETAE
jgi:hypothetical protein